MLGWQFFFVLSYMCVHAALGFYVVCHLGFSRCLPRVQHLPCLTLLALQVCGMGARGKEKNVLGWQYPCWSGVRADLPLWLCSGCTKAFSCAGLTYRG